MNLNKQGTIRGGMRGMLVADLGNGFATFQAVNGQEFTVHSLEFLTDETRAAAMTGDADAEKALGLWGTQPAGNAHITVKRVHGALYPTVTVQGRKVSS